MKYGIGILLIGFAFFNSFTFAITDPAIKNPGLDLYLEMDGLDRTTPEWFQPHDQDTAPENASYWINVLPFPEDRNEDIYLVIPGLGLVVPVVDIPRGTTDYTKMVNGQEIEINNYLKGGIIEYVNSVEPGAWGKRIDFGHSNYFTSDNGRYKTIFANLMWVDVGDELRYFQKQANGSYDLHKYEVTKSYPTDPSNVSALQWDGSGADALVFGCYHGLDGRRMVEATYLGDPSGKPQPAVDPYDLMSSSLKIKIDNAVREIGYLGINTRKYKIILFFKILDGLRGSIVSSDSNAEYKNQIIDYTEERLADIYPQ